MTAARPAIPARPLTARVAIGIAALPELDPVAAFAALDATLPAALVADLTADAALLVALER